MQQISAADSLGVGSYQVKAGSMSEGPAQTLIEELDTRQDELLAELEQLNNRIEQTLSETLAWRQQMGLIAEDIPCAA